MKKITVIFFLCLLFSFPVCADTYKDQLYLSGAENLDSALPNEAAQALDELGISLEDSGWINKLTTKNVFSLIKDFLISGGRAPLGSGLAVVCLIILIAAFKFFSDEKDKSPVADYVATLSVSLTALIPVYSAITAAAGAIKSGAQFMLSFVPVYGAVLLASGKPLTGASSGAVLLAAGEGVMALSSFVITPLVGSYLAVCITGSVSPLLKTSRLADLLKKTASWALGFIMTVYVGILSLQTVVNSAADNMAARTGRFLIGSFVPLVGGALSEALGTLQSSVSLLRSSIGIYGIVALIAILLPVVLELLVWRAVLLLSGSVADIFGCDSIGGLLKSADAAVGFLISLLLICSFAFIISLSVLSIIGG